MKEDPHSSAPELEELDREEIVKILVDGFFHDSGHDLEHNLAHGWHHVTAVGTGGVTRFYLDGEPVGHDLATLQSRPRQALVFDGKNDYLQVPEFAP